MHNKLDVPKRHPKIGGHHDCGVQAFLIGMKPESTVTANRDNAGDEAS
jgi:hypothetical protein